MITSQNAKNKQAYSALFGEATEILRKEGWLDESESINNLEDYFANIKHLFDADIDLKYKYKYIMLPLDEEPFDVDANSRVINIPANFKRHGVSVQGDEIAEMVIFRIDRFFDAVDFDACNAYVQWELAGDKEPHITPLVFKDVMTQPGKILLGWPISSDLTKDAGNVKISLRFIKTDTTNKIVYSFSTLTATVTVNPGLNYDIWQAKEDKPDELFKWALTNSTTISGIPAAAPEYVENLPSIEGSSVYAKLYLKINAETGEHYYVLRVSTMVADTGEIRYEWFHAKDGKTGKTKGVGVEAWEKTKDVTPNDKKYYYVFKNEDDEIPVRVDVSNGFEEDVEYFERYNEYTISGSKPTTYDAEDSVTGTYFVRATNRFGKRETYTDSNVVELPTASAPVIVENGDLSNGIIGTESGTLNVSCTVDPHSNTIFKWSHTLKATDATAEDFGEPDYEITKSDETAVTSTFMPTTPGYYKVNITSEVNLDAINIDSSIVKVTRAPEAVVFAENSDFSALDTSVYPNEESEIIAQLSYIPGSNTEELPVDLQTDAIKYYWYQDKDGKGVLTGNVIDEDAVLYEETTEPVLKTREGMDGLRLRCIAANELNGAVTYSSSKLYYCIDMAVE